MQSIVVLLAILRPLFVKFEADASNSFYRRFDASGIIP